MATATPQKNKRLSQANRDTLYGFAKKQITATESSADLDAAYEAAAQAVHDAVVAKYPQKDMLVLERYAAATRDACIYVSSGHYDYNQFRFRDGDKRIPLRPGRGDGCNSRNAFMLEGAPLETYEAFVASTKAHETEIARRLSDYKALILGANTFNEVVAIWPAAEALRESIVGTGTALTVLSSDVVARIRADAAAAPTELAA